MCDFCNDAAIELTRFLSAIAKSPGSMGINQLPRLAQAATRTVGCAVQFDQSRERLVTGKVVAGKRNLGTPPPDRRTSRIS
jgi:hypothetical protein